MIRRTAIFFLVLLLAVSFGPVVTQLEDENTVHLTSKSTGVDLSVTNVDISYTNSIDENNYRMFSSNHPILGFNRPAELYVIDSMVNVSATLTVTVENDGTASSGVIDVNVRVLHNEYAYFELFNSTVQMAALSGSSSNTVEVPMTLGSAGNHTLMIRSTSTIADDNPANDQLTKGYSVGSHYYNCDNTVGWVIGTEWGLNSDTSISKGTSCHVGNGQTSSYSSSMTTSLITPPMNMSDAIPNPLRTTGFSFYYTGSAAVNDQLKIYAKNSFGAWNELASLSGSVDSSFLDGANWQTFSVNNKGAVSPLIPMPDEYFHSSTQIKFEFTSDASGADIGYWFDELVFMYDQQAKPSEYQVNAQGISTNGALPGSWGSIDVAIENTGNISGVFLPSIQGIPTGWDVYYARPSGSSFDPQDGLVVNPNSISEFSLMIKPDANASIGLHQMTMKIESSEYSQVSTTLPVQFLVMADRIPVITPPATRPSCPPSFTCTFEVELNNVGQATDVFDLSIDKSLLSQGWDVAFAWSQDTSILIRPDQPLTALMTLTVPAGTAPDTLSSVDISMVAQNDSSRIAIETISVSASMTSIASVDLIESQKIDRFEVDAGETVTLTYTIWNNATRQDIFDMQVIVENEGLWIVHQPTRQNAVLNSGSSTTFTVVIEVPENAQANDRGPTIKPMIESQRSFMQIEGPEFDSLRVTTSEDLSLQILEAPTSLSPGTPNFAVFEVINNGNGATQAILEPVNFPDTWTWWITIDDEVHTGPLELSVSYDLSHNRTVEFWFETPASEAAGELHTIQLEVKTFVPGEDINPDDNFVEFYATTKSVRSPSIVLLPHQNSVMSGGLFTITAHVENQGNAIENRLRLKATVSSSPPTEGILSFLTIDGGSRDISQETDFMIPPGEITNLSIDVLVPKDAPLGTRLVVKFELLGAVDEEDLPIVMVEEGMVIIDQRRSMEVTAISAANTTVPNGAAGVIWVNHTSTSSFQETYILNGITPEGWQLTCNKILVNESGLPFNTAPGHISPVVTKHHCEVLRLSGPHEGNVFIQLTTNDEVLEYSNTTTMNFEKVQDTQSLSSATILLGSGGGVMLIGIIILTLKMKSNKEDDDLVMDDEKGVVDIPQGPPVSQAPIQQETHTGLQASNIEQTPSTGPPLPESGLPDGWTMEQWAYYGQQYLDGAP